jgi:hypothetical protein
MKIPLLGMWNVTDKSCRESQNIHFILKNFFQKSCCLWDNVEKYCRARQGTDDKYNMALTFCVLYNKRLHTHTHTQKYVIYCFPRKKWSRERASILPCRYMFYLSKKYFTSIKLKIKNTFTVTRNLVPKIALKSKPVPVTFLEILQPFLKN